MSALLDAAYAWHQAGWCVIPVRNDGTKAPAIAWKTYADGATTTPDQINTWFTGDSHGIGIAMGAASNGGLMLELEARALAGGALTELHTIANDNGLADLYNAAINGAVARSGGGGMHIYLRITDAPVDGNTKLAMRPDHDGKLHVWSETRGQGGYAVVAPTPGTFHPDPDSRGWEWIIGNPATALEITAEQYTDLTILFSALDQTPTPAAAPTPAATTPNEPGQLSTADDYNQRTTWDQILTGWTKVRVVGGVTYWRRPDKTIGVSATTGRNQADNLYVFTSSSIFPVEKPLSRFAAHAWLEHGGNYSAAAKALYANGYGDRRTRHLTLAPTTEPATTDGTAALQLDVDHADDELPVVIPTTLTDQGNAELLIARHGHRLRYVPARQAWLTWTGNVWAWGEDDGEPMQALVETIRAVQPRDDTEKKHQHASLSRRSLEAAVALARRHQAVRVTVDQLDADPYALNTPTGVLNLRTGELTPPTPEQLHTKITGVNYQPDATAPRFRQFLDDTFDNPELIAYVQRLAGYSALGIVTHHILPFLHGGGGNGKSVLLDTLVASLGEYASTAPNNFLMAGGREDEAAIARLAGLRLVVCSEVNQSSHFDEAKIKSLTGGDRQTARHLYGHHFTFRPSHTLILMGNHKPQVDAGGESFWRRLRLIPFTRTVPAEKRIEGLSDALIADEGPGILRWIVDGARTLLADGLREPQSVMAETTLYAQEEDALGRFASDVVVFGGAPAVKLDTADLRKAYETWCAGEGSRPLSPQAFGRELRSRWGIEQTRSHGRRYYLGVALAGSDDRSPDGWEKS